MLKTFKKKVKRLKIIIIKNEKKTKSYANHTTIKLQTRNSSRHGMTLYMVF